MSDFTPAKLYNCKGDVSKNWYVYYFVNKKMYIIKAGINRIKSKRERTTHANILVSDLNKLLKEGWRPRGATPSQQQFTLIDRLNEFTALKKGLRRRTWQSYEYSKNILVKWLQSKHYDYFLPSDFTISVCNQFFDSLQNKGLAGKTLNGHKANLSVLFNMMVERELISKNPISKIKKFPQTTGRNIAFTDDQRLDLEEEMKTYNYPLYVFTQWIYYTCIRPIELLRLKVSNVDMINKNIVIYSDQSKNKKTESIVIPDAMLPIIESMALDKFSPNDYLFGKTFKTCSIPYSRNSVSLAFGKVLKKLNFSKDYTLYSWKHTSVVNAFNAGINPYAIQRQLRHHSLDQTMIYLKSLGLLRNDEFGSKMK